MANVFRRHDEIKHALHLVAGEVDFGVFTVLILIKLFQLVTAMMAIETVLQDAPDA